MALPTGIRLGVYEITVLIGEGGMGQTVPATGDKRQISTQGGSRPRWRRDGKELYYLSADGKLMAVPVKLGAGTLEVGAAERLFDLSLASGTNRAFLYAPSANGQKFLASVPDRWLDAARHDLDELDGRHREVASVSAGAVESRAGRSKELFATPGIV